MRNVAIARLRAVKAAEVTAALALALATASFAACWPLAPVGGSISEDAGGGQPSGDASLSDDSGAPSRDGGTTATDGEAGAQGGDGSIGTTDGSATDAGPVDAAPPPPLAVATGAGFGCYVDGYGAVWCWGNNLYGQTGGATSAGPIAAPEKVQGLSNILAIAAGDSHACALSATGAVTCWGLNAAYQLGHAPLTGGDTICPGSAPNMTVACNPAPSAVPLSSPATSIEASGARTCVTGSDGSVQCWGAIQDATDDGDASIVACGAGDSPSGGECYGAPHAISGVTAATLLGVAFDHTCSTTSAGALTCWGYDEEGEVSPTGCPSNDCPPTPVTLPATTTGLALGTETTCALGSDGVVRCFGDNVYGQLGHAPGTQDDTNPDAGAGVFNLTPKSISGLSGVTALAGAPQAACALASKTVECWGHVGFGASPGVPTAVPGLPTMSGLGAIDATLACAIAADGSIWCWDLLLGGAAPLGSPVATDAGSGQPGADAGETDAAGD